MATSYEHPDMTPTRVSRPVALLLVVATSVVLLVPLVRHARGVPLDLLPLKAVFELNQPLKLWNYHLLNAIEIFEGDLSESAPLVEPLIPYVHWVLVRNGGMGNETVYVGPGAASGRGWLMLGSGYAHLLGNGFLEDDVLERRRRMWPARKGPIAPDPRTAILHLHEQLTEKGIELILLPVPAKPAIHAEPFGVPLDSHEPLENPSLRLFLDSMRSYGIRVVDLGMPLRQLAISGTPAYMRTDSHWSPAAINLAAQQLASIIEPLLPTQTTTWTRHESHYKSRGDLWPLLNMPRGWPLFDDETVVTQQVIAPDGSLWRPSNGASVLVLGDSFSLAFSELGAGLAEQLAYHLGLPTDRLAVAGGADSQVRSQLAHQPQRLRQTRVVVYQFAARELSSGNWPLVDFAPDSETADR